MHLGKRSTLLALPLAAAAVGIGVVPAFSAGRTHARPAIVSHVASISATARAGSAAAPVDHVTIYMFRKKSLLPGTPDGKFHDEAVPSTWAVRAGVWTEVTMINYDDGPHSLTIPQLGLDEIAQGGIKTTTPFAGETQWETLNLAVPTVTTFVFRVPKAGLYAWYCKIPCDGGVAGVSFAMTPANNFGMTGFIVAA